MPPLLELRGVSKSFDGRPVLRDVNLAVEDGEFLAIVGYSGAGKTTLISLLAGLLKPDAGEALMNGAPIAGPGPERGIVFQNYSLLPWLTVGENIALAVDQVFPEKGAAERAAHVDRYVRMVGLGHAVDRRPAALSGGMRQRVSVARALAMNPRVLLLDEPLSALDALTRATLQDEIEKIWGQDRKTVVLITNSVDEGILLADRIIPLTAGPGATLGPAVPIDIGRPRDRRALNDDARFKAVRQEVIEYLLGPGGRPQVTLEKKLVLPDIEPEDLSLPRKRAWGARPVRLSEKKVAPTSTPS
ncbi:MAG TPA: ABC transporter ATP-binding protein [Candidatus Methylacidiphilales bacterium]